MWRNIVDDNIGWSEFILITAVILSFAITIILSILYYVRADLGLFKWIAYKYYRKQVCCDDCVYSRSKYSPRMCTCPANSKQITTYKGKTKKYILTKEYKNAYNCCNWYKGKNDE
jgi:hypothetical protein